jgi:4-diphosphocytidyl-2-C-methyl-D-erythritol kinase
MSEITINARAKINLTLEVVRRLATGYHELRTVFQQIDLCDELTLADAAGDTIDLTCDDPGLVLGPANLVWRAADLVRHRYGPQRGLRLHLHKCIPVGGGMGGGSADAAATLVGLNKLWRLGLTQGELLHLAAELGMDVPFCVLGGTAIGTGRGERVEALPALPSTAVVIAHPGACVSTAEAYASLRPEHMGGGAKTVAMVAAITRQDMAAVAAGLYNVFELNIMERLPDIGRIKALMLGSGAWNAILTGSGACVFALAGSAREAERIAAAVRSHFPHVFVTQTSQPLEGDN